MTWNVRSRCAPAKQGVAARAKNEDQEAGHNRFTNDVSRNRPGRAWVHRVRILRALAIVFSGVP